MLRLAVVIWMQVVRAVVVCAIVAATGPTANGQPWCGDGWKPGLGIAGVNGEVYAIAALPNGRIVIGGDFTIAGNVLVNRIVMFDPTDGRWIQMSSGTSGPVRALVVGSDGMLYVGGSFGTAGGLVTGTVAGFDPDQHRWFQLAGQLNDSVSVLRALHGGGLVAGREGTFVAPTEVGAPSTSVHGVVRYVPGLGWSALGVGLLPGSKVASISVDATDTVTVGGHLATLGGSLGNRVACFRSALNQWSAVAPPFGMASFPGAIRCVLDLGEGDLLVSCSGSAVGVNYNRVARFDADTGAWAWTSKLTNGVALTLSREVDGYVFATGYDLTLEDGVKRSVARYLPDTGLWSSVATGDDSFYAAHPVLNNYNDARCNAAACLPDGRMFVGGRFSYVSQVTAGNLAGLGGASSKWWPLGLTINLTYAACVLEGGDVLLTGAVTRPDETLQRALMRLNTTTMSVASVPLEGQGTFYVMERLPSGEVALGGNFVSSNGGGMRNCAIFTPVTGELRPMGNGTNDMIRALVVAPDGTILAVGDFTEAGGVPAPRIARYNPVSNQWSPLTAGSGPGAPVVPIVYAISFASNGELLIGGTFNSIDGVPAVNIARWSPETQSWSAFGSGAVGTLPFVRAIQVLSNGDILVGGRFTSIGGTAATNFARLVHATGQWRAIGSGANSFVLDIAPRTDGKVVVSGAFTTIGGVAANRIAVYDPQTEAFLALGTGLSSSVDVVDCWPNGDVIAAGQFHLAGGKVANSVAWFQPIRACNAADVASVGDTGPRSCADRQLTVDDVLTFLTALTEASDCPGAGPCNSADTTGVGGPPLPPDGSLTVDDIIAFVNALSEGC